MRCGITAEDGLFSGNIATNERETHFHGFCVSSPATALPTRRRQSLVGTAIQGST